MWPISGSISAPIDVSSHPSRYDRQPSEAICSKITIPPVPRFESARMLSKGRRPECDHETRLDERGEPGLRRRVEDRGAIDLAQVLSNHRVVIVDDLCSPVNDDADVILYVGGADIWMTPHVPHANRR